MATCRYADCALHLPTGEPALGSLPQGFTSLASRIADTFSVDYLSIPLDSLKPKHTPCIRNVHSNRSFRHEHPFLCRKHHRFFSACSISHPVSLVCRIGAAKCSEEAVPIRVDSMVEATKNRSSIGLSPNRRSAFHILRNPP